MEANTNRLVHLYRSLKLKEWDIESQEAELAYRLSRLSKSEFMKYADASMEIDKSMDDAQQIINGSSYAYSTSRQLMHRAANHAGLDKEKV